MDKRPVIFLDSGAGCLPYGVFFHFRNAEEKLVCVADRANFPYGPKSKEVLTELLSSLTARIIGRYNPKLIAVACNTASVSALAFLREKYPALPFVGTVPAVKPAVLASKTKRVGVLGTERTIDAPFIAQLAARYGADCEIIAEAAPGLVEFAERRYVLASHEERAAAIKPWIEKFKAAGVDALVLGCTHFLLMLDEFRETAGSEIAIYDSVEGVCHRVESILSSDEGKLKAPLGGAEQEKLFAINGEAPLENYWNELATRFDFRIERF